MTTTLNHWEVECTDALDACTRAETAQAVHSAIGQFYAGHGNDLCRVLLDAGWMTYRWMAEYLWTFTNSTGQFVSCCEGNITYTDLEAAGPIWD